MAKQNRIEFLTAIMAAMMEPTQMLISKIWDVYEKGYDDGIQDAIDNPDILLQTKNMQATINEIKQSEADQAAELKKSAEQSGFDNRAPESLEGVKAVGDFLASQQVAAAPQADPEKPARIDGPENYRHALDEPGITECSLTGPVLLKLEMTTGERVTCPRCLASIEAKKTAAAV